MENLKLGLDKVTINNIHVKLTYRDRMYEQDNVYYTHEDPLHNADPDDVNIIIRDNLYFDDMEIYGLNMRRNSTTGTAVLTMDVTKLTGNNLYPLTAREYKEYLDMIENYLEDRYGLDVDFSFATYKCMEVTALIELSAPFDDFARILRMIMSFPNYHMGDIKSNAKPDNIGKRYEHKGWIRGNKEWHLIIYDKKASLIEKAKKDPDVAEVVKTLDPTKAYIHVEASLETPKKIQSALKERAINRITDETLRKFFWDICKKYLVNTFQKMNEVNNKEILSLMKDTKSVSPSHWSDKFFAVCLKYERSDATPLLIDVDTVCNMIVQQKDPHRNKCGQIKRLQKRCENNESLHVFAHHDLLKIEEFFHKLFDVSHLIC